MSDIKTPQSAYDPDNTPNSLAAVVDQDIEVSKAPPIAPTPVGETLLDAETGEKRHIPPNEDGSSVAIQAQHEKPWLEVMGHDGSSTGGDKSGDKGKGDR